jgi:putative heme-binding domain-containing protein
MPVSQQTGPHGCLYILDWYDRYHCYQDAGRDPAGIDRLKGRLYRVRYKDTRRVWNFDLAKDSDDDLLAQIDSTTNTYFADTIFRLLAERHDPATRPKLQQIVLRGYTDFRTRLYALRALAGSLVAGGARADDEFLSALMSDSHPAMRAWGVRLAGNNDAEAAYAPENERGARRVSPAVRRLVLATAHDISPDVRLQAAIASPKVAGVEAVAVLIEILSHSGDDPLIPHIVWNNLQPWLVESSDTIVDGLAASKFDDNPSFAEFTPRLFDRLLLRWTRSKRVALRDLFHLAIYARRPTAAQRCLRLLSEHIQNRELSGPPLEAVKSALKPGLRAVLAGPREGPLFLDAALLAASWHDPAGTEVARMLATDAKASERRKLAAIEALAGANDPWTLKLVETMLAPRRSWSPGFRARLIAALARLDAPQVADVVLSAYDRLDSEEKPLALQLLTQRVGWSKQLLAAIGAGRLPAHDLNLSQVRKLLAFGDNELIDQVHARWGSIRDARDPQRERVIARMRKLIRDGHGNAAAGEKVFQRICGQCHKIHGKGNDVGPEITNNGRSSFEQLLSNVFDPNLVIGAGYRAVVVVTNDGRVLTGLLAEDSPQRVVLKIQGGKTETIPRNDIDTVHVSNISLMPEQIENQMKPQEIVDLFTFLSYDKHPSDPAARRLPGIN